MHKRMLFVALAILIIIPLMALSAQCRLTSSETPTLELEIYDGPNYMESDDMCYYRVEAISTGIPDPEIEFSIDDNVITLGPGRVEISIKTGDSYTLTATAKNSAGTATVSITLAGECDETVEEEEAADEEVTDEDIVDEDATDAEESDETDADEEADDGEEYSDAEKEAPTINLAIYEGPALEGSICYYRVEATVSGSPNPTVSFSKDDSGGAWGSKKTQINIIDPGDSYTLTATATNSEGSATDSIVLDWGCAVAVPEPDPVLEPDPIVEDRDIIASSSKSGYIAVDYAVYTGSGYMHAFIGDYAGNKPMKTYISFDISSLVALDDVAISDVSIAIPIVGIIGHPELAGSEIHIKVYDYGDSLELSDQGIGGVLVKTISVTDSLTNLNFSTSKLEDELQKAVDVDKHWFQIKIGLSGVSSNDIEDLYRLLVQSIVMHFEYEIPG